MAPRTEEAKAPVLAAKPAAKDDKIKKLGAPVPAGKSIAKAPAAAKTAKAGKPAKARGEDGDGDGDGDGDDDDDDFAPPPKAKGKPGKRRGKQAAALPDLLDDDDVIAPVADFVDDEEDELALIAGHAPRRPMPTPRRSPSRDPRRQEGPRQQQQRRDAAPRTS